MCEVNWSSLGQSYFCCNTRLHFYPEMGEGGVGVCPGVDICPGVGVCPRVDICPGVDVCPGVGICPGVDVCPGVDICPGVDVCPGVGLCPEHNSTCTYSTVLFKTRSDFEKFEPGPFEPVRIVPGWWPLFGASLLQKLLSLVFRTS